MTIGENLKAIRKRRGFGQVELADRAGVSQPTVSEIENGHRGAQTGTLTKLADALDVPVAAFFGEGVDLAPKVPAPTTPNTRLPSSAFEELRSLFRAEGMEVLEGLQTDLYRERQELGDWLRALRESDAPPADVRAAQELFQTASKRFTAIILDQSEAFIALDKKRPPRPSATAGKTVDEIAAQVGAEQQKLRDVVANEAERKRIEEAGEAS